MSNFQTPTLKSTVLAGLGLMEDAHEYSVVLNRNPSEFAVHIDEMRAVGCTENDLRFLMIQGYVDMSTGGRRRHGRQDEGQIRIGPASAFVLTDAGLKFYSEVVCAESKSASTRTCKRANFTPQFAHRELWVGNKLVKQFRQPAKTQEAILLSFEELDWADEIDDPLPKVPEIDPKLRLRQTIANLNRHQKTPLLHFFGNGTGKTIRWQFRV
jgi:hypothetical protein